MTAAVEPLAALLSRRAELQRQLATVREAIGAQQAAAARAKLTRLAPDAAKVLAVMAEHFYGADDWAAFPFKSLAKRTELTRDQVRRACRALARLGFARCEIARSPSSPGTSCAGRPSSGWRATPTCRSGRSWRSAASAWWSFGCRPGATSVPSSWRGSAHGS
jgi:hypothetical protein